MSGWDRTDMDRTDMGSDGHGIPSRIAVTFRMIPPGNKQTWDRTDMGSLLGSNGPSVSTYFLRADSVVSLSHTSSV
jgi:hypothetical protein